MTDNKKLIDDAPEHIRNMSSIDVDLKMREIITPINRVFVELTEILQHFKISIDWVGDECVCYPFQNNDSDDLEDYSCLRSVRDKNPRIAIAKAVIWKCEVLNG